MLPINKYPHFRKITVNHNINIYVIDDLYEMNEDVTNYDIVIHGHTHKPSEVYKENTLILNPGSFGPPRFSLPISLATIELNDNLIVKFHQI